MSPSDYKKNISKKTILLYRNPFDFTVSYYFYFYKNTIDLSHVTFNDVIQDILEHYKKFYFQQRNIWKINKNWENKIRNDNMPTSYPRDQNT